MKGVVLAGGLGTRLSPVTRVVNKHLLPVYDRPMVAYPIAKLAEAGVREIMVVTGEGAIEDFQRVLGGGEDFGLDRLEFAVQKGEGGIADALRLSERFAAGDTIAVILGDNIFEDSLVDAVQSFRDSGARAGILLKEVPDPERFGVAVLRNGRVIQIVEKPSEPPSNLAVTGIYFYDAGVFEYIRSIRPSARGELEITDVNNRYIEAGKMSHSVLSGWWTDAGTFESLYIASDLARRSRLGDVTLGDAARAAAR